MDSESKPNEDSVSQNEAQDKEDIKPEESKGEESADQAGQDEPKERDDIDNKDIKEEEPKVKPNSLRLLIFIFIPLFS